MYGYHDSMWSRLFRYVRSACILQHGRQTASSSRVNTES